MFDVVAAELARSSRCTAVVEWSGVIYTHLALFGLSHIEPGEGAGAHF